MSYNLCSPCSARAWKHPATNYIADDFVGLYYIESWYQDSEAVKEADPIINVAQAFVLDEDLLLKF